MSLTFLDLKTRLARSILRNDLAPDYGEFINEALREIQNRKSFVFMRADPVEVVVPASADLSGQEVDLPADFKELLKKDAVFFVGDANVLSPAEVVFKQQQIARVAAFGGSPAPSWPPRVYFERYSEGAVLGILEPVSSPLTLLVNYYKYLPALAADTDTSALVDAYPKLVLAKAKAIAFSEVNDYDAAGGAEVEFEKKLGEAIRQDAYSEVVGRTLHM